MREGRGGRWEGSREIFDIGFGGLVGSYQDGEGLIFRILRWSILR